MKFKEREQIKGRKVKYKSKRHQNEKKRMK